MNLSPADYIREDYVKLAKAQTTAIKVIKAVRILNRGSVDFKHCTERLGDDNFESLLDDDSSSSPVNSFIIGAILFWNLSDVHDVLLEDDGERFAGLCNDKEGQ